LLRKGLLMLRIVQVYLTVMMMAVAVACQSGTVNPPQPSPSPTPVAPPTAQPATDDEAIRELIRLEGAGIVSQDLDGLMGLWAEDAVITDAKHTPDDASDDARWKGRDAIRDRYVVLVFPGAPSTAGATEVALTIAGDTATASATTAIGDEVAPMGDLWTFARRDGRWWITGLTYNLEPDTP
jgi:ketosteroid isomerase-like protein